MKTAFRLSLLAGLIATTVACQPNESAEQAAQPAESAAPATEMSEMAAAVPALETEEQKQAYSLGASVGLFLEGRLQEQESLGISVDKALVLQGFTDGIKGEQGLTDEEIQAALQALDGKIREQATAKAEAEAEQNRQVGVDYLTENAKREGVMTTESGLQYEVVSEGEGDKPAAEDVVTVHYRGTLIDGTEFDSSYSRNEPATFPLNRVIPGWTEGLQLMSAGSTYKLFIPAELGYGSQAVGSIPANSTLVFEVELLSIESADESVAEQEPAETSE